MQIRPIVVTRGATNRVQVQIKNSDRKPLNLPWSTINAFISDSTAGSLITTKELVPIDESIGLFEFQLSEIELLDIKPGFYKFSLTSIDENGIEEFLYSDQGYNTMNSIEVRDSGKGLFRESVELDPSSFLYREVFDELSNTVTRFFSSGIPTAVYFDQSEAKCTYTLQNSDFTGRVFIQGTLEPTPPVLDIDWYPVLIQGQEYVEFNGSNETVSFSFDTGSQYVRFVLEPAPAYVLQSDPVSVVFGGANYAVNDHVILSGGIYSDPLTVRVDSVSSGAITSASIWSVGRYIVAPTNPIEQLGTTGVGSGATFSLNFRSNPGSITKILFRS